MDEPWTVRRNFLSYKTHRDHLLEIADALLELLSLNRRMANDQTTQEALQSLIRNAHLRPDVALVQSLQEMLTDARSVYEVRDDWRGLDRRSSAAAAAAMNEASRVAAQNKSAGSAEMHLRGAWNEIHALEPNPAEAYGQAIKAVEAAAHAVVGPDNDDSTLGTMIRELSTNDNFELAISGGRVSTLRAMMSLLWYGQTSRHGGQRATRMETLEQAEMAVQLAVTLVEWFASGKVKRRRKAESV